jgi:hypothetical protein
MAAVRKFGNAPVRIFEVLGKALHEGFNWVEDTAGLGATGTMGSTMEAAGLQVRASVHKAKE